MKAQYRLTRRGKVVVFLLVLIMAFSLNSIISDLFAKPENNVSTVPKNVDTIKKAESPPTPTVKAPVKQEEILKIYFDPASSEIDEVYYPILDEIADRLITTQDSLLIEGVYNATPANIGKGFEKLSDQRGNEIYNYLITKGAPASKIIVKNAGSSKQENKNQTEEEYKKNRRADLTFIAQ